MTALPNADEGRRLAQPRAASIQTYARIAGILFLISVVAGGFGEFYVPSKIMVPGDASATAQNIVASNGLFRLGFAAYFVEALCDITLTLIFYVLFRPTHKELALLASFFRIVSTATFAAAELFAFATLHILGADYLKSFSPDQVNAIALLSLKLYGIGAGFFMVFYGVAAILHGWLIFRSTYLPKALGVLLALAGLGFVARSFLLVLAPAYAGPFLLLPMSIAGLSLTVWFLVKGVDVARWEERAS
jgi:hypothetical protein